MSVHEALVKAVELAGGAAKLAERLREITGIETISQQTVWNWLHRNTGPVPPPQFAIPIEQAVDGDVTRYELRPDLYPTDEDRSVA